MIKRLLVFALVLMLTVPCYAQTREASQIVNQREGQTAVGNLILNGGPGQAPGYLVFQGVSASVTDITGKDVDVDEVFYLWIGSDGKLRIASDVALHAANSVASPPTTYWSDVSGPVVGP